MLPQLLQPCTVGFSGNCPQYKRILRQAKAHQSGRLSSCSVEDRKSKLWIVSTTDRVHPHCACSPGGLTTTLLGHLLPYLQRWCFPSLFVLFHLGILFCFGLSFSGNPFYPLSPPGLSEFSQSDFQLFDSGRGLQILAVPFPRAS